MCGTVLLQTPPVRDFIAVQSQLVLAQHEEVSADELASLLSYFRVAELL